MFPLRCIKLHAHAHVSSMSLDCSSFSSTCTCTCSSCSGTHTIRILWTNLSDINSHKWKLCMISQELIKPFKALQKLIHNNTIITRVTHIQCSSGVVYCYSFRIIQLSLFTPVCTDTLDELSTASVQ